MVKKEQSEDPEGCAYEDEWGAYTDDEVDNGLYETDTDMDDVMSQYASYTCPSTFVVHQPPPIEWKLVKVGDTVLHVSSHGKVKPYKSLCLSTNGFPVAGTPYYSYPVEHERGMTRNVLVHDLVWQAFRGTVPPGWDVRHTLSHTRFAKRMYSNAIWNLTLYPSLNARDTS